MASPSRKVQVLHSDNNAFNPRPAYSSQHSSIRPRNRRLISTTEQELAETNSIGNGTSEPNTRSNSPIPAKYPSRTSIREGKSNGRLGTGYGYSSRDNSSTKTTPGFGKGLFEGGWTGSWSALQELAREVLGNANEEGEFGPQNGAQKRSASTGGILGSKKGKSPESWGPEGGLPRRGDESIGAGTLATREAELRTRKMRSVLESWEGVNGGLDVQGRHKRRTSTDNNGSIEVGEESDAMVYVHHVQPSDTLAGVVLKYNCDPAIFRKANRLWPNDTIQVKKVVLLPVDACSIKGRPCGAPSKKSPHQNIDLLAPTPEFEDAPTNAYLSNGRLDPTEEDDSMEGSSSPILPKPEEQRWTHVRWVMLFSSSNQPTEIARLPRKTLGYFPPPRRKSITTGSTVSSPRASFDLPSRISTSLSSTDRDPNSPSGTPSRRPSNLSNGSYFPPHSTSIPPPLRREAMSTATHRRGSINADSARLSWMRGPGGVGSLSGRKIGSGNDSLNKWAHKHFPAIAIDDLPSTSIVGAEAVNYGFDGGPESLFSGAPGGIIRSSGTSTPVTQGGMGGNGLESAAAAIEGWVRRLAVKSPGRPGTPRVGMGNGRVDGDLIELLDGAGSDDGRGFEPLDISGGETSSKPMVGAGIVMGSGRSEDLDGLRGRGGLTPQSSYLGKVGGKSD